MGERSITIEEVGKPVVVEVPESEGFDLQDGLLISGVITGEAASIVIWWPSALILASLLSFVFWYLIEKSKRKGKVGKSGNS